MPIAKKELIEFTQKLIQTPSNSGEEEEIAKLIANEMKRLGYEEVIVDEKNNVTGVIKGEKPGKNLMFNGHIDHAGVGNMKDPFKGEIIEGDIFGTEGKVIYGRGACDMKAAVAAMVYAGAQLQEEKQNLPGNVYITAVAFEEQAKGEGITYLLDNSGYTFDAAVSGEATDMEINLGHRGKFEYLIKTHGKTCHSSNPNRGINAIFSMNKLISEIENNYAKSLHEHEDLGKNTVTVIDILAKPGRLTPVVPDYCEMVMDRRYLPNENNEVVEKELEEMFEKIKTNYPEFNASYEMLKDFPVLYCPPDKPVVKATKTAVENVMDKQPEFNTWKFGVDGAFISQRGIPCVGFGPGNENFAHTEEDHVKVEDVYTTAIVYHRLAYEFNKF